MFVDNQKTVSVIVTTYNRPKILERNIVALLGQKLNGYEMEIFVMDDCSTQENSEMAKRTASQSEIITYSRNEKNKGLSGSRNAGASKAKSEFILFLDDDIIAESGYVQGHLDVLSSGDHIATVGSLRFPPELTKDNNLMKYLSSRELRQRGFNEAFLCDLNPQHFGGGICGMRLSDFKLAQGFNEGFLFYGGEDVEMGYNLKQVGVRIAYAARAKADHYDSVFIDRYRHKYIESGREGIKLLLKRDKYFFKYLFMRFMLPVTEEDSFKTRLIKFLIHLSLGPFTERILRSLAKITNKYSFFYSQRLYHILFACWMREGVKNENYTGRSMVEYKEVN